MEERLNHFQISLSESVKVSDEDSFICEYIIRKMPLPHHKEMLQHSSKIITQICLASVKISQQPSQKNPNPRQSNESFISLTRGVTIYGRKANY